MALNPVSYTEKIVRSFLRYQLGAYPLADPNLHKQMRDLLSLDATRQSPLLRGPYVSLSQPFRPGAPIDVLVEDGLLHPHLHDRISGSISNLYSHQELAIRSISDGRPTLISTGTGSGKTECFLYPIVSKCFELRDSNSPPGISAVIVYPMNALAEDQLMRLRGLLSGTGVRFGMYVGKTKERAVDVAGIQLPAGSSRADYEARLEQVRQSGTGETVYPPEEVCSREAMRTAGNQPRVLLTNVKQLELLLTRQQDVELFAGARLDFLVFDEAHTFAGALGAETACLIRRLRAYCDVDADSTTCVATSATIVDREDSEAASKFAARFFGVPSDSVTAVGEEYEREVWVEPRFIPLAPNDGCSGILEKCLHAVEDNDSFGQGIRSAYRALAGEDLDSSLKSWSAALHQALSRNEIIYQLHEALARPKALDELLTDLEVSVGRPVSEEEILAWLALGAAARRDGRPLLRPVMHGFVRGIGGAVVSFPNSQVGPKLWLAAEDDHQGDAKTACRSRFPVATCTTCGQHYYIAFLEDFSLTAGRPEGGRALSGKICWPRLDEANGGNRVVLFDRLIGEEGRENESHPSRHFSTLYVCRNCGAAHSEAEQRCLSCGIAGCLIKLYAVRSKKERPGKLSRCLACGSNGRVVHGRYREPARPVRATTVADVHVLTQDMVHHAERRRLLVFCDNRQDAAFQSGWMQDHARRFRLRALMAEGLNSGPCSVGDLAIHLDERLNDDEALSRALIPEVWKVSRRESAGDRHVSERRKYLRFQVLVEVTLSSRQRLGLEPWGRMRVDYLGLDSTAPWIQDTARGLGIPADRLREGIAGGLDHLRRNRILYDPEYNIFTKYWMDGDREVQQGYLTGSTNPKGTKLRRESQENRNLITQWISERGDTAFRQFAKKWAVPKDDISAFLGSLFGFLVESEILVPVQLTGARGGALPRVHGVYQVHSDRLQLSANRELQRCRRCSRTTARLLPHNHCLAWRCTGELEGMPADEDNYDLQLLDGAYAMLRPAEHTAMVPNDERERLENLFRGDSEAVNCIVCTPTLELGIDIGQLDSVLMRNVPPLAANYWQRAGRAGRRHRMAVTIAYCRAASHDRAYFADPPKLLAGRIDPPAFNLRNEVMVAKHVHATVIATLHRYSRDPEWPASERERVRTTLDRCLPRTVTPYLFEGKDLRPNPFDFGVLRALVQRHSDYLMDSVQRVFQQGWPEADAEVIQSPALRGHVEAFVDSLEAVIDRIRARLQWAMKQIDRLSRRRIQQGTLDSEDEALFRRADNLVRRLKGARPRRSQAAGHDDHNTYSVLAAEGFLPGYGLEVGSVTGWADIPFWRTGAMSFELPRPPSAALREYVPGNLVYANGHRFVARRFHRDVHPRASAGQGVAPELAAEMPYYEVSTERQALQPTRAGERSTLGGDVIQTMSVCDVDLIHSSHISDEEDLRFQLSVAIYGIEQGQHSGGQAYRWGAQSVHLRHGARLRLVNIGPSITVRRGQEIGYPVCTVCGQSVSPLSSESQREHFRNEHAERCGSAPRPIGFHADVAADALSLPSCGDATAAYSTLEALRIGATRVLDMQMEDLQILVIGHSDREEVDGILWDPMPGGSGLLDRLCDRFEEISGLARAVIEDCPAVCESSCIDCLQTFRNAYYHRYLNRRVAGGRLDEWGARLEPAHRIPPVLPSESGVSSELPANDAEVKLQHLLRSAGFGDGVRNEQIRLDGLLGTTTPDVIYRSGEDTVCIYLDGLSRYLHGDPGTAARDREIRTWLRNQGSYEVIEISVNQLDDEEAMVRHFRRLANYLERPDLRSRVRIDRSWFCKPLAVDSP